MSEKRCETCKYWDEFSGACCNGLSPMVADFTDRDNWCDEWEKVNGKEDTV